MDHQQCHHLLGSLSEFVEGNLEDRLCAEIERHLSECENCRVVVDTLHKTILLYQESSAHVSVPADVRQRLFRCLDLDEFTEKNT